MARTLLLTTGTSIANRTEALDGFQRRTTGWDDDSDELRQQIRKRLQGFDLTTEQGRVRASAELNILQRLPVQPNDQVVLFSTDTAEGRACCEELARVIQDELGINQVRIHRVEGLQVRDAETLRNLGLTNLIRLLISYLEDDQLRYQGGCVLCPNGGFRGVVPFMSVLGMVFRAPVVYVFEFSDALISLPPIPITFATDLFERALPALAWAKQTAIFDVNEFYRRVPGFDEEESHWFDSFLEITPDDTVGRLGSLSPLATVLAERELRSGALRISKLAAEDLERLGPSDRIEVEHHLSKLISPLWRSQHRDNKFNNDLEFYPRGHNPWRFAGFTNQSGFHLCWFASHSPYERLIPQRNRQRAAFPIDSFTDYVIPADSESPVNNYTDFSNYNWFQLVELLRDLTEVNKRVTANERAASQAITRLEKLLHEARNEVENLALDLESKQMANDQLAAKERLAQQNSDRLKSLYYQCLAKNNEMNLAINKLREQT